IKLTTITVLISLTSILSFGQIQIDEFYDNQEEYLIYSVVEELDSLNQEEIKNKVKNWAGTKFNNMNEVLVSETDNQLVFRYITKSFYTTIMGSKTIQSWYIRMVVQIKDNKMKISMYDDGNSYWAGSKGVAPTKAGSWKFDVFFKKDGSSRKSRTEGLKDLRTSCISTTNDLIASFKEVDNDDW
ncbi:MAG: hypothetical protein WD509_01045, partial [Candidatus Paceibacterota bacterium]